MTLDRRHVCMNSTRLIALCGNMRTAVVMIILKKVTAFVISTSVRLFKKFVCSHYDITESINHLTYLYENEKAELIRRKPGNDIETDCANVSLKKILNCFFFQKNVGTEREDSHA